MRKNKGKVGSLWLSTSETDINSSKRPHTPPTHPQVTNKHNSMGNHSVYQLNIHPVDLGRAWRGSAIHNIWIQLNTRRIYSCRPRKLILALPNGRTRKLPTPRWPINITVWPTIGFMSLIFILWTWEQPSGISGHRFDLSSSFREDLTNIFTSTCDNI